MEATAREERCPALDTLERQEERHDETRELLLRLEGRIERLADALVRVSDGEGVNRCVEQRKRLEFLEERFAAVCGRIWKLSLAAASAAFMVFARAVWEAAAR